VPGLLHQSAQESVGYGQASLKRERIEHPRHYPLEMRGKDLCGFDGIDRFRVNFGMVLLQEPV
jgi:hypothetical protein